MKTKKIVLALAALSLVAFSVPAVYAQDAPADDPSVTDDGSVPELPADPDAGDDSSPYPEDGMDPGDGSMDGTDVPDEPAPQE